MIMLRDHDHDTRPAQECQPRGISILGSGLSLS